VYSGWRQPAETPADFVARLRALLDRAEAAGSPAPLDGLQLDPHLRADAYEALVRNARQRDLPALAARAYAPVPDVLPSRHAGGTRVFDPASLDPEELRMAAREGRRTLAVAASHGIGRVIVDLGRVGAGLSDEQVAQLWRFQARGQLEPGGADREDQEPGQGDKRVQRYRQEREARAVRHLDRLRSTLGVWLDEASRRGVQVALTNRARIDEIPTPTEALLLFEEFRGAPLGLELDLGRAYLCESIGGPRFGEWVELVAPGRLDGLTVHDACGHLSRLAPGTGDLALGRLLRQLAPLLGAAAVAATAAAPAPAPPAAAQLAGTTAASALQLPTTEEVQRLGRTGTEVPLTLMLARSVTPAELLTSIRLVRRLWTSAGPASPPM
jgi:sugar phosphate isomerase/epimerase